MEELVQQEFQRIMENIGKQVEVIMVSSVGEEEPLKGTLAELMPYDAINIGLGAAGRLTVEQTCPFVGAMAGIKSIKDGEGNEIYSNEGLHYEDKFYDLFQNKEDNEYINKMRRAKFGEGYDYKMFD